FEAGLIVGIVMAATRAVAHRGWWVGGGVTGGVIGACTVAAFAGALSATFNGVGPELFNAGILGVAAGMLTWHNVRLARRGRACGGEMQAVGQAVPSGVKSLAGLAIVVGVAVLREGVEVVLFLYGVVVSSGESGATIFAGGMIGLMLGALVCALTYLGLLAIPSRYLFAATGIMIAFLAAGLAAPSVAFLGQAGVVSALANTVWASSSILSEKSMLGRALHTLIGYSDQPTALQLVVYLTMLAGIFFLMKLFAPVVPAPRPQE